MTTLVNTTTGHVNMLAASLTKSVFDWLNDAPMARIGNKSNQRQEAELMSALLESYWKVASKRFLDNVPKLITTHLLHKLGPAMFAAAMVAGMGEKDKVFAVSEATRLKRKNLEDSQERLMKAREAINNWNEKMLGII